MKFYSTRDSSHVVDAETAILAGLAPDGGLYMPEAFPALPSDVIENLGTMSLADIGVAVSKLFLAEEIAEDELGSLVREAINFDAPLVQVSERMHSLELYHGPTHAFKDFGARFMARLVAHFIAKHDSQITILVATSGDTGGAVASGFLGVPGVRVVILYPSGQVSELQERQLTTLGGNITALKVDGTFDDCQRMAKRAFVDVKLQAARPLGSANSINIARLLPQSFYYFYGYSRLPAAGRDVVFCVPSGNFGNLTAGLFARLLGLPLNAFIAATNVNDVVPNYLDSGEFNPRPSTQTISNAMDVGSPSNFERMQALFDGNHEKMSALIHGCRYTDDETRAVMKRVYEESSYMLDPHGAVAYLGLQDYLKQHPNSTGVFLETAHPAKFLEVVESALGITPELPPGLQNVLDKKQEFVPLENDYQALRRFLLAE